MPGRRAGRVRAEEERIHARIAQAEAEAEWAFHAVLPLLLGHDRPEVLAAFRGESFAAFLDAHCDAGGYSGPAHDGGASSRRSRRRISGCSRPTDW